MDASTIAVHDADGGVALYCTLPIDPTPEGLRHALDEYTALAASVQPGAANASVVNVHAPGVFIAQSHPPHCTPRFAPAIEGCGKPAGHAATPS